MGLSHNSLGVACYCGDCQYLWGILWTYGTRNEVSGLSFSLGCVKTVRFWHLFYPWCADDRFVWSCWLVAGSSSIIRLGDLSNLRSSYSLSMFHSSFCSSWSGEDYLNMLEFWPKDLFVKVCFLLPGIAEYSVLDLWFRSKLLFQSFLNVYFRVFCWFFFPFSFCDFLSQLVGAYDSRRTAWTWWYIYDIYWV